MQQLLLTTIHNILPYSIRGVITQFYLFFDVICKKVIDSQKLNKLKNKAFTIVSIRNIFCAFVFYVMVHLIVHLVRKIWLCGPVYLRWMYHVERYMKILKRYVKN